MKDSHYEKGTEEKEETNNDNYESIEGNNGSDDEV